MERRKRGMEMYLTSSGCRSTRDLGSWTCRRRPWSPSSPGAPRSSSPTAPNQHCPSRNPDRIHGRSKTKHLNEIRTLHRSSRVLRGDPSSAVFRASTGFDLRAPPQKGLGQSRSGGGGGREEKRGKGGYCLRRVSILRDFCSMRVMMASRFSSASGYAAEEAIPTATGRAGRVGFLVLGALFLVVLWVRLCCFVFLFCYW